MNGIDKRRLLAAHRHDWMGAITLIGFLIPKFVAIGIIIAFDLPVWSTVALMVLIGYLMHTALISFHESAHSSLCPHAICNDGLGILVGTLGFMSLALYRAAHRTHHLYLAGVRDEELWPFTITSTPRWARRLAALAELWLGLLYTPLLFLRAFLRPGTVITDPAVRRRIWAELGLITVTWATILGGVAWFGVWHYFVAIYLVPAIIAGNLQSWRKYVEHMGMFGSTARGSTRSIHATGWAHRLLSVSLLNEPYHGIHHQFPKLPQRALPEFADLLEPQRDDEPAPYPSYTAAMGDLLRSLHDPRIGAQWLANADLARDNPLADPGEAAPRRRAS